MRILKLWNELVEDKALDGRHRRHRTGEHCGRRLLALSRLLAGDAGGAIALRSLGDGGGGKRTGDLEARA